jgi:hypothetical protein
MTGYALKLAPGTKPPPYFRVEGGLLVPSYKREEAEGTVDKIEEIPETDALMLWTITFLPNKAAPKMKASITFKSWAKCVTEKP